MLMKKLSMATAAAALALSPTIGYAAQPNVDRSSAPTAAESNLEGKGIILALLAAAAVIAGIIIIADDEDEPVSA